MPNIIYMGEYILKEYVTMNKLKNIYLSTCVGFILLLLYISLHKILFYVKWPVYVHVLPPPYVGDINESINYL